MKQEPVRPGEVEPPVVPAPVARRRGKALEQAIFEAALDQLTSGGFARMTMEGVAGAAQTGKAALYRRWSSKLELALDALAFTLPPTTDIPDLGSVRDELLRLMGGYQSAMDSRGGAAMRALMAELDHDRSEVVSEFVMNRVIGPAREAVLAVLRRGERRGDVRPGGATELAADVGMAMLFYREKFGGSPASQDFTVDLVDQVLMPMIRPAA
ncbi:TetR/AcrR family transcriptional regulator [Kitasatospora sp. NPDC058965]|uniref:TetR/AcrR family transcriptional regulator n=1 Tax=Kitasatospora sp. NPDC058965 TaxID=3346682 RepID=UPI0036793DA9